MLYTTIWDTGRASKTRSWVQIADIFPLLKRARKIDYREIYEEAWNFIKMIMPKPIYKSK